MGAWQIGLILVQMFFLGKALGKAEENFWTSLGGMGLLQVILYNGGWYK